MALQIEQKSYTNEETNRLFFALAEQFKLPLLQIARSSELARLSQDVSQLQIIETIAAETLELIDSYILSTELMQVSREILLEPVSLSATLSDVAHQLKKIADSNGCDVELHVAGKYGPVLAHPLGLRTALINIGKVFVGAQSERTHSKRPVLKLAAHKTSRGITAGMFADIEGLNTDMLKRARQIYGKSRQPLVQLTSVNGVGVFIADSLLSSMSSGLRVAHHQKLTGLAATFNPSQQLSII